MLVCLLPVRNGAADLPGYFDSVARFADAIVALDDGSTDDTRELLESHPLVQVVLTNPRRDHYRGWDDSANRNRLLAAAAQLAPDWIISLDADERLDAADAVALREFLATDAVRGDAYLLQVIKMIGDLDHYEPGFTWVGRLFAYEPGQEFPRERLHFVALPTSIPKSRWRETTIRIQHLAHSTAERRADRFEKYLEVDPARRFQASYDHLLQEPERVEQWRPRSPALPVVKHQPKRLSEPSSPDPLISAIVIAQNDEDVIERSLVAIVQQDCADSFEIILVTSGMDRTAAIVRERFPQVHIVELDLPALPGEARNVGLRVARGHYVTFVDSLVELAPGSFAALIRAFRKGYAMVTSRMDNGTPTPIGWATWFLDNQQALPGRPDHQLRSPPVRCSYVRALLLEVGGFTEDLRAGGDTVVNAELFDRGYSAYLEGGSPSIHHSPCRTPSQLVRHHFERGRGTGRTLLDTAERERRIPNRRIVRFVTRNVPSRLRGLHREVVTYGAGLSTKYWLAWPLIALGAISGWLGACYELARSGPAVRRRVRGRARTIGGSRRP